MFRFMIKALGRKSYIAMILAIMSIAGLWKLQQPKWYVLNEEEQYINIVKESEKPTVAVLVPISKEMWPTIFKLSTLTQKIAKSNGKVAVILPMEIEMLLDTAKRVKQMHKLNLDFYLAPLKLWNNVAEEKEPKYVFIKNRKIINTSTQNQNWLSNESDDFLKNIFGK